MYWIKPQYHNMQNYTLGIVNDFISRSLSARHGRDRMVDGFITTYAISDYHH